MHFTVQNGAGVAYWNFTSLTKCKQYPPADGETGLRKRFHAIRRSLVLYHAFIFICEIVFYD